MKLPDGNALPPSPGRPAGPADVPRETSQNPRQMLDQLKLENRQAVVARVVELLQARGEPQALLELKGQALKVDLPANLPRLTAGELVAVMRDGNSLQLLGAVPRPAEAMISQALARHLPWQHNLANGLQQLLSLPTTGLTGGPAAAPGSTMPLAGPVRESLQALAALLPQQTTLTRPGAPVGGSSPGAEAVRQWLQSSGLATEARLAQGRVNPSTDLKLALGRVVQTLLQQQGMDPGQFTRFTPLASPELASSPLQFPAPPPVSAAASAETLTVGQALRLLAGMLNRLTVNQLHSQLLSGRGAEGAATAGNSWVVDLPWLNPQGDPRLAYLRLEEWLPDNDSGRPTTQKQAAEWRFTLVMTLDNAGPLTFDVALKQGTISARVWAEQQDTLQRVSQRLDELRQSFAGMGLEVTSLECRRGTPPAAVTRLEHRLVDVKA